MCEECPSIFMEKHRLNTHKKSVHLKTRKGNKKELKCRFCEKKYNYSQHLKEHILQKHEKSTPFTCDQCTRSFGMKSRLKRKLMEVRSRIYELLTHCIPPDAIFVGLTKVRFSKILSN